MNRPALAGVLGLLAVATAAPARASDAPFHIPVPAGLTAFRCAAGLPESIPDARVLAALARRDTSMPAGTPEGLRASRYLAWLGELQARLRRAGSERELTFRLATRRDRSDVGDVVDWLGLRLRSRRDTFQLEERDGPEDGERRAFASCLGASLPQLANGLETHQSVRLIPEDGMAPSPVPLAIWQTLDSFREAGPTDGLARLASDRRALLMYHGFMGLDDATLAWLVAQPRLLKEIHENLAAPFAIASHAIRVRDNRVLLPGGDASSARWARIVDRDPADVVEFVRRLLQRDDGAAADFFATLHALPVNTQRTIAGSDDFERLYSAFRSAEAGWKIHDNPFSRPGVDPSFVLLTLLSDGMSPLAGPRWRALWEAGFDARALSLRDAGLSRDLTRGDEVSLSWLLAAITRDAERMDGRLALASFARRRFATLDAANAGEAAVVLGAFQPLSLLVLEMERAGVRDAAVFARVAERARQLADEEPQRGALTMVSWQAVVGIVCALATSGAIDGATASVLLDELARTPTGRDNLWDGAMARFMGDRVAPLLGQRETVDDRAVEDALLEALSRAGDLEDSSFTWEGLEYRTTIVAARGGRAKAIARAQARLPLDGLIALVRAADVLPAATTVEQVRSVVALLDGIEEEFPEQVEWLFETEERPLRPASFIERQLRDVRRVERERDISRARRAADRLRWLADLLTVDTLAGVIYAARLGVGLQTPSTVAAVWRRHEFGFRGAEAERDPSLAWRVPAIGALADGGWHMRGALLGLDQALGESWLRRVGGGPVPMPTRISDPDLQVLFRTHALLMLSPPLPVAMSAELPPVDPGNVEEARRRRWLEWAAAVEDEATIPPAWRDAAREQVPAWGTAPDVLSCLCRASSVRRPADVWLGRPLRPTIMPLVPDLSVRVAGMARAIGLPPVAIPVVLAAAFQDLLDGATLAYADDWETLAVFANSLSQTRFEEFVFALIATGELTPVQKRP